MIDFFVRSMRESFPNRAVEASEQAAVLNCSAMTHWYVEDFGCNLLASFAVALGAVCGDHCVVNQHHCRV